jgi:MFS family permease
MSDTNQGNSAPDMKLFWGCFIALITTAFGFIGRMFLIGEWSTEFNLDPAQAGRLAGIGIWPFAVSIIGFSLIIDKIGYRTAMIFAFLGHIIWAVLAVGAYSVSKGGNPEQAYQMIYWGSLILALGNGTVEAFINPVVATMFNKDKTKWLNILHAGWPGGLVVAGMIVIFMGDASWNIKVGIIAIPAVIYLLMLLPCKFPVQEREAAGVSYKQMLSEFGILGAIVVGFLVTLQLMDFFGDSLSKGVYYGIGIAIVVGFGVYTKSLGNKFMFLLVLIMMPLATTEIGTDGWIEAIMKGVAEGKFHAGWVLVYTSAIMMVLRFYAGPIVHKFKPLPLLAISAAFAIVGLYTLSFTVGMAIFAAATLYGVGKTFFWPTMLGVVSEQTPKGGALTLNAIAGIGMLAVGTLGFPYIGALQAKKAIEASVGNEELNSQVPGLVADGKLTTLTEKKIYEIIAYEVIDDNALNKLVYTKSLGAEVLKEIVVYQKPDTIAAQIETEKDAEKKKDLEKQKEDADKDKAAFADLMANKSGGIEKSIAKAKEKPAAEQDAEALKKLEESLAKARESEEAIKAKLPATVTPELITATQELTGKVTKIRGDIGKKSSQGALADMAIFPFIMLISYIGLIMYFKGRGGYKPIELDSGGSH